MKVQIYKGDNFNFLSSNEMKKKYNNFFDFVYLDPPYNSNIDSEKINYKDSFDDVNYRIFINKRLNALKNNGMLKNEAIIMIQIDENGYDAIYSSVIRNFGLNSFRIYIWDKLGNEYNPENDHKLVDEPKNIIRQSFEYIFIIYNEIANGREISVTEYEKRFFKNIKKEHPILTIIKDWGTNKSAKEEMEKYEDGKLLFETPKPIKLIYEFLNLYSIKTSMNVLDIFGGSGTTALAVKRFRDYNDSNVVLLELKNDQTLLKRLSKNEIKCEKTIEIKRETDVDDWLTSNNILENTYEKYKKLSIESGIQLLDWVIFNSMITRYFFTPFFSRINSHFFTNPVCDWCKNEGNTKGTINFSPNSMCTQDCFIAIAHFNKTDYNAIRDIRNNKTPLNLEKTMGILNNSQNFVDYKKNINRALTRACNIDKTYFISLWNMFKFRILSIDYWTDDFSIDSFVNIQKIINSIK